MNNRILAALFALALALFIGVAPVEAEAAHKHVDNDNDYVCDISSCTVHVHHLSHFAATDATCTVQGHIEYWQCLGGSGACKKCYTDEAATTEIAGSDTVLAATGHVDEDKDCVCDVCEEKLAHKLKEVPKVEATCTTDGNYAYKECETCGKLFWAGSGKEATLAELTIPATDHDPSAAWFSDETSHWHVCKNVWPSVEERLSEAEHTFEQKSGDDNHWQECTVCGYKKDEAAHTWDRVSNGDGTHTTKCTACAAVMGNQTWKCKDSDTDDDCVCDGCGGPVEHDKYQMKAHAAVAATCTESGTRPYWDCPFCGKLFVDGKDGKLEEVTDVTTEALDHTWKYVKDTLNGQHLLMCTRCKAYQTSGHVDSDEDCLCDIGDCDTPVHSHKFIHVDRVEPTCGKDGTEEYLMYEGCGKMFDMNEQPIDAPKVISALEHEWSEDWEAVEGGHTKKCVNCGETQEVQPHVYANGNPHCTLCGAEEALEYFEGKEPTCTEPGFKEYWKSEVTDRKYSDAAGTQYIVDVEEIPALGHQFDTSEGEQHVCATCGEKEDHVADPETPCFCKVCYHLMPGHEMAYVPTVPATCTEDGTKAYFRCSCGKLYDASSLETAGAEIEKPATIPAIGHKLSGNLVEDTRLGDHYRYCVHAGCDYEIHSEHDCKAEDPLSGNYHQFVCECGYTRSEIHYDKDGDKKCDECGHDMANTTVTVEQHDSIKVITGDKAKVDNTQSWWKNWWNMLTSSNAGSQTSGNTPAASATTGTPAAPAESGDKPAPSGGSTGTESGTQSEKSSTGTGSQSVTQKPSTETVTQNPDSATAQNSFRNILFQVWNWLNGLFASK